MTKSVSFSIEMSQAVQLRALNYVELKAVNKAVEIGMACDEQMYESIGKRNVVQAKLKQAISTAKKLSENEVTIINVTKKELMVMLVDTEVKLFGLMQKFNKEFDTSVVDDILLLRTIKDVLNAKHKEYFARPLTETEMNS